MKVIENITIYRCDFCKKELKRKYAMEQHEIKCWHNPVNQRQCFNCEHLERKEISFETGIDNYNTGESFYAKAQGFYCNAKNILLLHPKTQWLQGRNNLSWVILNGDETEQFDMPKQCDVYDKESADMTELNKHFNKLFDI